jgi:hypothetical protein
MRPTCEDVAYARALLMSLCTRPASVEVSTVSAPITMTDSAPIVVVSKSGAERRRR